MGLSLAVYVLAPLFLLFWLAPFLLVAFSKKTQGSEKFAWILAMIFVSWFAWIFYLIFAPLAEQQNSPD